MPKVTLNNISSGYASTSALNDNFALIETAFDNTLSLDGSTPNSMGADLDMNSNSILNLPYPASSTEPVRLLDIQGLSVSPLPAQSVATNNNVLKSDGSGANWELQDAADVTFTPTGNIAASTVSGAIIELDTEKATPAYVDSTSIAFAIALGG